MAQTAVRYDRHGAVAVITIDRPPVNAYDEALERDLAAAWRRAADDDDAAVVMLRAEGPHFCAGVETSPSGGEGEHGGSRPGAERAGAGDEVRFVRDLAKPTIAAVQGGCVGGGQRFVFPCDLIFCSDDAFFRDPMPSMGMGGVLAPMATWLYGPRLAKEMLFSGMRLTARRLYETGAVNRIVPRDRLWSETLSFATEIAALDPWSLRQAKRAVNAATDLMGQHQVATRLTEQLDHRR